MYLIPCSDARVLCPQIASLYFVPVYVPCCPHVVYLSSVALCYVACCVPRVVCPVYHGPLIVLACGLARIICPRVAWLCTVSYCIKARTPSPRVTRARVASPMYYTRL